MGEKGYNNRRGAGTATWLKGVQAVKRVGLTSVRTLYVREGSLYSMRSLTLSQWRDSRMGVICVDLGARAREFWIC